MDVAARINYFRDKKNLSVYKLALDSELTQSTLHAIVSGKSIPNIKTLEMICYGLNISLADFFKEPLEDLDQVDEVDFELSFQFKKLTATNKILVLNLIKSLNQTDNVTHTSDD